MCVSVPPQERSTREMLNDSRVNTHKTSASCRNGIFDAINITSFDVWQLRMFWIQKRESMNF